MNLELYYFRPSKETRKYYEANRFDSLACPQDSKDFERKADAVKWAKKRKYYAVRKVAENKREIVLSNIPGIF